jgi:FkbM family methyltransferase
MNKDILVYGTGSYSVRVVTELENQNIKIAGYLDSNKDKLFHNGLSVYSLENLIERGTDTFFIIVGSSFYKEIANKLNSYGLIEYINYCNGNTFLFARTSYSQYGEDLLIEDILRDQSRLKNKGFYIDIGAYHPYKYSNTHKFYLKGWRGINIEPTPNKIKLFDMFRPEDININVGISSDQSTKDFYIYNEHAFNTLDFNLVQKRIKKDNLHYSHKEQLIFHSLQHIIDTYVQTQEIDLLNIDVEGHEMDVLNSYDWNNKPYLIAIEIFNIEKSPVKLFLESKNYRLVAKSLATGIFLLEQ